MSHQPVYKGCPWLRHVTTASERHATIQEALGVLRQYEFDSIAFRGVSGAMTAPILAYLMNKNFLAVRKGRSEEYTHSAHEVEGDGRAQRYIIVDDFVADGTTVNCILQAIKRFAPNARCLGVLEINAMADVLYMCGNMAVSMGQIKREKGRITEITDLFFRMQKMDKSGIEVSPSDYIIREEEKIMP